MDGEVQLSSQTRSPAGSQTANQTVGAFFFLSLSIFFFFFFFYAKSPYGYGMLTPARCAGNNTITFLSRQQLSGYVSAWFTEEKNPNIPSLVEIWWSRIHIDQSLEFPPHRVPGDGAAAAADDVDDDDDGDDNGVCQRLGLCGQGESSICSTGLQSPSFWLM